MANQGNQGTGLAIGDFDIGEAVIKNRVRVMALEKVIDKLIRNEQITPEKYAQLQKEAIQELDEEYPGLGLEY